MVDIREQPFEDAGALFEPPDIRLAGDGNGGGEAFKTKRVCDRDENGLIADLRGTNAVL